MDWFRAVRARTEAVEAALNARLPGPLKVGFLTLYWYSHAGIDSVDRLAAAPRWDDWHDLAVGILLAVQVLGFALVAAAAWLALGQEATTALNDPTNVVAIPGVNDFMPLAAAGYVVVGLLVATVVHEAGHAVACRREGIPIQEWGVAFLFGVLPLAAYVLPGEELDTASDRTQVRVFAAGVVNNLVVAAGAFAVLLSPLTATPRAAYGTYFGWALTGGLPPTAAAIEALGPLTSLCFWLVFLNVNVGLLNALPVTFFDGGRVLSLVLRAAQRRVGLDALARWNGVVLHALSLTAASLVILAVVGPHLR